MKAVGVVVHHSPCPAINGKGYDYMILKNGMIIPAAEPADTQYVHICLEGDFNEPAEAQSNESKEQVFLLLKLIQRLSRLKGFSMSQAFSHTSECPGKYFPWSQLVISDKDGYH